MDASAQTSATIHNGDIQCPSFLDNNVGNYFTRRTTTAEASAFSQRSEYSYYHGYHVLPQVSPYYHYTLTTTQRQVRYRAPHPVRPTCQGFRPLQAPKVESDLNPRNFESQEVILHRNTTRVNDKQEAMLEPRSLLADVDDIASVASGEVSVRPLTPQGVEVQETVAPQPNTMVALPPNTVQVPYHYPHQHTFHQECPSLVYPTSREHHSQLYSTSNAENHNHQYHHQVSAAGPISHEFAPSYHGIIESPARPIVSASTLSSSSYAGVIPWSNYAPATSAISSSRGVGFIASSSYSHHYHPAYTHANTEYPHFPLPEDKTSKNSSSCSSGGSSSDSISTDSDGISLDPEVLGAPACVQFDPQDLMPLKIDLAAPVPPPIQFELESSRNYDADPDEPIPFSEFSVPELDYQFPRNKAAENPEASAYTTTTPRQMSEFNDDEPVLFVPEAAGSELPQIVIPPFEPGSTKAPAIIVPPNRSPAQVRKTLHTKVPFSQNLSPQQSKSTTSLKRMSSDNSDRKRKTPDFHEQERNPDNLKQEQHLGSGVERCNSPRHAKSPRLPKKSLSILYTSIDRTQRQKDEQQHPQSENEQPQLQQGTISPTERDVLCGKGGKTLEHNFHFTQLCSEYAVIYTKTKKRGPAGKRGIAENIVATVQSYHGRFLKGRDKCWTEISHEEALKKVAHCIRDIMRNVKIED